MQQQDPDAVTNVERETWNRSAPSYLDSAAELTSHGVAALIESARLASGCRALEVACGPGHITKMLADTGAKATGVDLAPGMVEVARELYQLPQPPTAQSTSDRWKSPSPLALCPPC